MAYHLNQLPKKLKLFNKNILKRPNKKGDKFIFYYDFGRGPGQRPTMGIFIYKKPKDQMQKNHNKEALALLETKKSQATIEITRHCKAAPLCWLIP